MFYILYSIFYILYSIYYILYSIFYILYSIFMIHKCICSRIRIQYNTLFFFAPNHCQQYLMQSSPLDQARELGDADCPSIENWQTVMDTVCPHRFTTYWTKLESLATTKLSMRPRHNANE